MRRQFKVSCSLLAVGLLLTAAAVSGYPVLDGCGALTDDHFRYVKLVEKLPASDPTIHEPIEMDFNVNSNGDVDVYFVELAGNLKKYDGTTGLVSIIGNVDPRITGSEDGVSGIALDPNFSANGHVFLFYTYGTDFVISRFTITSDVLSLASEVVLLEIPRNSSNIHTAGAMDFDDAGNLWIAVGDNAQSEEGPGNTSVLLGGIIRIHPESNGTYTVPAGNFGEYWASYFEGQGDAALAADYRNPAKVRPELFVKGTRNAYTMNVDPERNWVVWGDCGPDFSTVTEEHNLVTHPTYAGWPYFAGANFIVTPDKFPATYTGTWGPKDPSRPTNSFPGIQGVSVLPPAPPSIYPYQQACAMTGPIYKYDRNLASDVKFPPHFNNKWVIGDFNDSWLKLITVSDDGSAVVAQEPLFSNFIFYKFLDLDFGPDGALYINNYAGYGNSTINTGIARVEYVGPGCDVSVDKKPAMPRKNLFSVSSSSIAADFEGEYILNVSDLNGRMVKQFKGAGKVSFSLGDIKGSGVYIVEARTAKGVFRRQAFLDR